VINGESGTQTLHPFPDQCRLNRQSACDIFAVLAKTHIEQNAAFGE
jgi:hypothetical protein